MFARKKFLIHLKASKVHFTCWRSLSLTLCSIYKIKCTKSIAKSIMNETNESKSLFHLVCTVLSIFCWWDTEEQKVIPLFFALYNGHLHFAKSLPLFRLNYDINLPHVWKNDWTLLRAAYYGVCCFIFQLQQWTISLVYQAHWVIDWLIWMTTIILRLLDVYFT